MTHSPDGPDTPAAATADTDHIDLAQRELRLAILGASGRMGRALIAGATASAGMRVVAAIDAPHAASLGVDAGILAGCGDLGVTVSDALIDDIVNVDAVIDFTTPDATVEAAELTAQARIVHVIGTTGFADVHDAKLAAAARHATIVKAGNMSLGVNLLTALSERVAAALPADFDIEVVEMHHRHKVDAPSGTALMLGDAAARGRGQTLAQAAVRARDGMVGPRTDGEIGFATLRGGSVVGEHSVVFAGTGERIVLEHIAQDRSIFANGALTAARWAQGRKPGLYDMIDVLGLRDL
ncbi:MAG: 4-hydroxy-tetrahydrodipicolinate reductase [Pseudomonadota bacterium]